MISSKSVAGHQQVGDNGSAAEKNSLPKEGVVGRVKNPPRPWREAREVVPKPINGLDAAYCLIRKRKVELGSTRLSRG